MGNITYEQFVAWCKHWDYTVDEGYRAMCFTANILGQHLGNCVDYEKEVSNNNRSDAFKDFTKKKKDDAISLYTLYGNLESAVFNMLEKHDEES